MNVTLRLGPGLGEVDRLDLGLRLHQFSQLSNKDDKTSLAHSQWVVVRYDY